jgi:putative endonuclease
MDPPGAQPGGRHTAPRQGPGAAGAAAEGLVVEYLMDAGWTVFARNVRAGHGEIDIVALDPAPSPALVIVEVRWRKHRDFGLPEETFNWRKRGRLRRSIGRLLGVGHLPDGTQLPRLPLRVDLIVVEPPVMPLGSARIRHHRSVLGS